LDTAGELEPGAFSVIDIIDEIKKMLQSCPDELIRFEGKLIDAGYVEAKEYQKIRFQLHSITRYEVTGEFPRLQRSEITDTIVNATYELSVQALSPFKINPMGKGLA
jgi:hypothetical protein